ncbi:MAG: zinc ABC transporter substrate-binding protein [Micropepsaceae bacterium]
MTVRTALAVVFAALWCAAPADAGKLKVVASFSILGDMTARIAGDRIELKTLVGPDGDAHVFEPTPADARAVAQAQLVIVNGLNYEPWVERLLKSTKAKAKVAVASAEVEPLQFGTGTDPHTWQDARSAIAYAENITRALVAIDKPNVEFYKANAVAYVDELRRLDAEIRASFASIPATRRRVITTHDAFAYFGKAYGLEFIAPLGTSTEEQVSAKEVAALIVQIKREKISAVFVENVSDPRLIEQIARETGAKLGGKLYSDALSTKQGAAPTYIALMRHNAKLLTAAMAQGF